MVLPAHPFVRQVYKIVSSCMETKIQHAWNCILTEILTWHTGIYKLHGTIHCSITYHSVISKLQSTQDARSFYGCGNLLQVSIRTDEEGDYEDDFMNNNKKKEKDGEHTGWKQGKSVPAKEHGYIVK